MKRRVRTHNNEVCSRLRTERLKVVGFPRHHQVIPETQGFLLLPSRLAHRWRRRLARAPSSLSEGFDHRANGYARGEGYDVVVIKLPDDALRDGDTVRAIIRAVGFNHDEKTRGLTQPDENAQEALARLTYRSGDLYMKETRYFEAHGTGPPIRDPIEAGAIDAAFRNQRAKGEPLFVGAVKSNIRNLEGARGIASLIKTCLVLVKGLIPPNMWFERANPSINGDDWNIQVRRDFLGSDQMLRFSTLPVTTTPWPSTELRRASVNSVAPMFTWCWMMFSTT